MVLIVVVGVFVKESVMPRGRGYGRRGRFRRGRTSFRRRGQAGRRVRRFGRLRIGHRM